MGRADDGPLVQPLLANHRQEQGLAPVVPVYLIPGLQLLAPDQGAEAGGLGLDDGVVHALPLGLAGVQEGFVALAVGLYLLPFASRQTVIPVFGGEKEFLPQLLGGGLFLFFLHGNHPSCKIFVKSARARWAKVSTVSASVLSKVSSQRSWNQALGFWAATRRRAYSSEIPSRAMIRFTRSSSGAVTATVRWQWFTKEPL